MNQAHYLKSEITGSSLLVAVDHYEQRLASSEQSKIARDLIQEIATKLGHQDLELQAGILGQIVANKNIAVSVSHTSKFSQTHIAAVVADLAAFRSVGIDLENIERPMSSLLSQELLKNPCSAAAREYYEQRSAMELYCSLEAAYKALSPLLAKNFDLRKINLGLAPESGQPTFSYEDYSGNLVKIDYIPEYVLMLAVIV